MEEDDRVSRTAGSMKDGRLLLTRFLARRTLSYMARKDSERLQIRQHQGFRRQLERWSLDRSRNPDVCRVVRSAGLSGLTLAVLMSSGYGVGRERLPGYQLTRVPSFLNKCSCFYE